MQCDVCVQTVFAFRSRDPVTIFKDWVGLCVCVSVSGSVSVCVSLSLDLYVVSSVLFIVVFVFAALCCCAGQERRRGELRDDRQRPRLRRRVHVRRGKPV